MLIKNSKTTQLTKNKFALDAFIGAVQMSEDGNVWQDIKPRLVESSDGWHIEGAPYYAKVLDNGERIFCPNRNTKSQYLKIPSFPLVRGSKAIISNPTKIDGELLPNTVRMAHEWGHIDYIFTNTGLKFGVYFEKPTDIFGKDSPRILLDQETMGLDILKLLAGKKGLGIPRPRLIADNGVERWLDWSYKNGQLELGFDLTGFKFPVLLQNATIDEQVGAGADDSRTYLEEWSNSSTSHGGGLYSGYPYESQARFEVTIPGGQTITACYLSFICRVNGSGTALTKIWAEDVADPNQIADYADFMGVTPTTAQVDWDISDNWTNMTWYDSVSLLSVEQELYASYDYSGGAHQNWFWKDDGSSTYRQAHSYDSDSAKAPKLHIEYEAGGGTAHEKSLSDTLSISDTLRKSFGGFKADSVGLTDAIGKAPNPAKSDSVTVADSISKGIEPAKADNLTVSETIAKASGLAKADTVDIADTLSKAVGSVKADIVAIADSFSKVMAYVRTLSDTVSITDSISKGISAVKTDTMTLVDNLVASMGAIHTLSLSDIVTITDSLAGIVCKVTNLRVKISRMAFTRLQASRMPLARYICRRFWA